MATASDVLRIARAEVGYCRYDDPERGTKYGRWYESEVDGPRRLRLRRQRRRLLRHVRLLGARPGGRRMRRHARGLLPEHPPQPDARGLAAPAGDLVLFDWDNDNTDDHIGHRRLERRRRQGRKDHRGQHLGRQGGREDARLLNGLRRHPPGLRRPGLRWRHVRGPRPWCSRWSTGTTATTRSAGATWRRAATTTRPCASPSTHTCATSPSAPQARGGQGPLHDHHVLRRQRARGSGQAVRGAQGLPQGQDRRGHADQGGRRKPMGQDIGWMVRHQVSGGNVCRRSVITREASPRR